jgi:hypothetical protein
MPVSRGTTTPEWAIFGLDWLHVRDHRKLAINPQEHS